MASLIVIVVVVVLLLGRVVIPDSREPLLLLVAPDPPCPSLLGVLLPSPPGPFEAPFPPLPSCGPVDPPSCELDGGVIGLPFESVGPVHPGGYGRPSLGVVSPEPLLGAEVLDDPPCGDLVGPLPPDPSGPPVLSEP